MARSSSEEPRDVVNMERLQSQIAGVRAEGERQLKLAQETLRTAEQEKRQATTAAEEAGARRRQVGVGGTPAGVPAGTARTEEQAAREAVVAEGKRLQIAQQRVNVERQGTLDAAERVRALNLQTTTGAAQNVQATVQAEQRAARATALANAQAVRQAGQRVGARGPLLLGPGGSVPLLGPGGGGGGQEPPVVPPAPPGGGEPPRGIKLSEVSALTREQQDLVERARLLNKTEADVTNTLAYQARVIGLSSNAYQKHGYLTSEFIQAAARGQVTMREFGTQIAGTIGKFAGWTGAAAAVYGTLGALTALGHGAIAAASGVQLVNRVVTDRGGIGGNELQGRFSELSRKFNLPVDDVVQAVYGSAKAFGGDLPQALKASESALFAVKVGELSAADSTRYLTAIVNGFRLEAGALPAVFDAMNQAQNRFGGSIQQNIAGVAKAAGAVRLAGGNYRQLIALIQTGVKVTGVSGENVGTAISRSASRVITPQGIDALRAAGLNPQQSYPQLIQQAFQEAQGASRTRVREIAGALVPSGGQFVRILAPILQNQSLYNRVYDQIAPDKAKGSASRELATALKAPDEQVKRLLLDVQRLGIELGRLGALNGLLVFVRGFDLALNTADRFLSVINRIAGITGPFKGLTVGALELYGVLRLLRRFDLGGALPTGRQGGVYEGLRGGLRRSPADLFRAQTFQGLDDQRKFIETERQRAAQSAGLLGIRTQRQGVAVTNLVGRGATEEEIASAQARFERLQTEYLEAVDLESFYQEQGLLTQRQIVGLRARNLKSIGAIEQAMVAEGVLYTNPTLQRPAHEVPIAAGQEAGAAAAGAAAARTAAGAAAPAVAAAAAAEEAQLSEARAAIRASEVAQYQGRLASVLTGTAVGLGELGRSGAVLGGALGRMIPAAAAAGVGATGLLERAKGAGASLAALARSLGPLDYALLALFALPAIGDQFGKIDAGVNRQLADLRRQPNSAQGVRDQYAEAAKVLNEHHSFVEGALRAEANGFDQLFHGHFIAAFRASPDVQAGRQAAQVIQRENDRQAYIAQSRQLDRPILPVRGATDFNKQGQPVGGLGLYSDELIRQVEHDAQARRQGLISQAEFDTRMANHRKEVPGLLKASTDGINAAYSAIANEYSAEGGNANARRALLGLDPKGLQQALAATLSQLQDFGGDPQTLQQARNEYATAEHKLAANRDSASITALSQFRQQYFEGVKSAADATLQDSLANARTEGQRQAAYATYQRALRQGVLGGDQGRRDLGAARIRDEKAALDRARAALHGLGTFDTAQAGPNQFGLVDIGTLPHGVGAAMAVLRNRVGQEGSKLRALLAQQGIFDKSLDAATKEFNALVAEAGKRSAYDDRQQGRQINLAFQQSKLTDPVQKDAKAVEQARQQVHDAAHTWGVGSRDWKQAMTGLNEAIHQQTEDAKQAADGSKATSDAISLYSAQLENATARASIGATQGAQLARAVSDSQKLLAFTRSHSGSAQDILQASTAVFNAEAALVDFNRQQAAALLDAQQAYKTAGLDPSNKVAAARIALGFDQRRVGQARTPAERLQARAQVRTDRESYRDARFEDVHDNIEFQLSMDRIDNDAAATQLDALAQRVKHNKALRRQYEEEAHRLRKENEGTYQLDIGSVRIPTPYEVARSIKEGRRGQSQYRSTVLNQDNRVNVTVEVKGDTDLNKLGDVLDTHLRGGTRSALRARGVIG